MRRRLTLYMVHGMMLMVLATQPALGLGPHEVIVVANRKEPVSVEIAHAYMQGRQIPSKNLVLVSIEPNAAGAYHAMSRADFTVLLWDPVSRALRKRELDHVLAWVFSTHIPYRVDTDPPVSVQGLTFLRNTLPASDLIAKGQYRSRFFAGPDRPGGKRYRPQSLLVHKEVLQGDMPIPSMALGYIGPGGMTKDEVLSALRKARSADSRHPQGTVYFLQHDDVRARARSWQFRDEADVLQKMGVDVVLTNQLPRPGRTAAILGIMEGRAQVDTRQLGAFAPGAMADHLTSFAAAFDQAGQTKATQWIVAGASGTAGTVSEPFAVWTKFPHARFFSHYRVGCTMLESFYLSIRCPLQLMLLGDPLVAPWAPKATLAIEGLDPGETLQEPRSIDVRIQAPVGIRYSKVVYLVDGRMAGEGTTFVLDPDNLAPGLHTLRVVAYRKGVIRSQVMDRIRFIVPDGTKAD